MANSAFTHDPQITVPGSSTDNAVVIFDGTAGTGFGNSTILVDSGGNGRIGIAADTNVITLTSGVVTIAGTVAATTLTGAGAGITALAAANITASGTLPALNGAALTALNASNLSTGTLPAARIGADSIIEGKLNVSNGPTNGYVLTARDGVAGGYTWEAAAGGADAPLILDQGGSDAYILELRSSDVAHGISGVNTETYGFFAKKHGNSGMLRIWGLSDADANQAIGLSLTGVSGIAANATKTTSAIGIVEILGGIKSGSTVANAAANGNILVIRDAAAGAAKLIVDQDGDVTLPVGNLVIGTSGKGIDFSAATPDESGAGAMSSEILDDYEEGTWTPTLGDSDGPDNATYNNQLGYYTKIGNAVFWHCFMNVNSTGSLTSANQARIYGLPFVTSSDSSSEASIYVGDGYFPANGTDGRAVAGQLNLGQQFIIMYLVDSDTNYRTTFTVGEWGNSGTIRCAGWYRV